MILEDPVLKDYIIGDIIRGVEQKGLDIEKVYVENFIDNFINEYERLPKKNEIKPIVSSYLKTLEGQALFQKIGKKLSNRKQIRMKSVQL